MGEKGSLADLDAGALGDEVAAQLSVLCSHADGPDGSCGEQPLALLDHLHRHVSHVSPVCCAPALALSSLTEISELGSNHEF